MVGIIDYGMGNLLSVFHAVEATGHEPVICSRPADLAGMERLILPGVGAFRDCLQNLRNTGFAEALQSEVIEKGKPILGICLGMQAMARKSFEGGEFTGLGWFEADVVRIKPNDAKLRVPQIGWNNLEFQNRHPVFAGLPASPEFYFVHSYHLQCDRPEDVVAVCDYGGPVTAAVARANIVATQCHPEKSQEHGLRLLGNFMKWKP